MKHLASITRIAQASVQGLTPFVGAKVAEEIAEHFRKQKELAESAKEN